MSCEEETAKIYPPLPSTTAQCLSHTKEMICFHSYTHNPHPYLSSHLEKNWQASGRREWGKLEREGKLWESDFEADNDCDYNNVSKSIKKNRGDLTFLIILDSLFTSDKKDFFVCLFFVFYFIVRASAAVTTREGGFMFMHSWLLSAQFISRIGNFNVIEKNVSFDLQCGQ